MAWAADLPRLGYAALLCTDLVARARPEDPRAAGWLGVVRAGLVAVAVLPVLVFGAGLSAIGPSTGTAAQIVSVALLVVLFSYSGREWSGHTMSHSAARQPDSS